MVWHFYKNIDYQWHEDQSALTLKPSSGGLEQLVTNFSSLRFSSSVKPSTTSQKVWITGWVAVYPPEGHGMEKLKIPLYRYFRAFFRCHQLYISHLYGGVNTPGSYLSSLWTFWGHPDKLAHGLLISAPVKGREVLSLCVYCIDVAAW